MSYRESKIECRHQLGMKVRQLRKDQHLSQAQLGLMIGRDRSYISRIERGLCSATLDTLLMLAEGLGISVSELLRGIGEPERSDEPFPIAFTMSHSR